jgi:putative transposase
MTSAIETRREDLRSELEAARREFYDMVASISEPWWAKPSRNPGWMNGQLLFHVFLGFILVLPLAGILLFFGHLPASASSRRFTPADEDLAGKPIAGEGLVGEALDEAAERPDAQARGARERLERQVGVDRSRQHELVHDDEPRTVLADLGGHGVDDLPPENWAIPDESPPATMPPGRTTHAGPALHRGADHRHPEGGGRGGKDARPLPPARVSEQNFYRWKARYGGLEVSELRRLRQLEDENSRLKHLVADLTLDNQALKEMIRKRVTPAAQRGYSWMLV